jgi:hypothetical protein
VTRCIFPALIQNSYENILCAAYRVSGGAPRSSERSNVTAASLGPRNGVPGGSGLNYRPVSAPKILTMA